MSWEPLSLGKLGQLVTSPQRLTLGNVLLLLWPKADGSERDPDRRAELKGGLVLWHQPTRAEASVQPLQPPISLRGPVQWAGKGQKGSPELSFSQNGPPAK